MINFLKKNSERLIVLGVLLATAWFIIYTFYPTFTNPYIISDDARCCTYWMRQFQDPKLFNNDLLTDYSKQYQPWGYVALFYLFSFVMDPVAFSDILAVLLVVITAYYTYVLMLFYVKDKSMGIYAGILVAYALITSQIFLDRMVGGFPRSFAYPLLISFMYYFQKKKHWPVFFNILLQVVFYPIISLLSLSTWGFSFLGSFKNRELFKDLLRSKNLKIFFLCFLLAGVILSSKYLTVSDPRVGKTFTRNQIREEHPELLLKGRIGPLKVLPLQISFVKEFFVGNSFIKAFFRLSGLAKGGRYTIKFNVFLSIFIIIILVEYFRGKFIVPSGILWLLVASFFMHEIATIFFMKFHSPYRYFYYSVSLISILLSGLLICHFLMKIPNKWIRIILQIMILILLFRDTSVRPELFLYQPKSRYLKLFKFLESTPKDSMVAAYPYIADDIPMYSKRSVFINWELSHPMYDKYWETIKLRTTSFFYAYFSNDIKVVYSFLDYYDIDYLIVEKKYFSEEFIKKGKYYFPPFNSFVKSLIEKNKEFALNNIPDRLKLFKLKDIFIIKRTDLFNFIVSSK